MNLQRLRLWAFLVALALPLESQGADENRFYHLVSELNCEYLLRGFSGKLYAQNHALFSLESMRMMNIPFEGEVESPPFQKRISRSGGKFLLPMPQDEIARLQNVAIKIVSVRALPARSFENTYVLEPTIGLARLINVVPSDADSERRMLNLEEVLQFSASNRASAQYAKSFARHQSVLLIETKQTELLTPLMAQLTRDHSNTAWRALIPGLNGLEEGKGELFLALKKIFQRHFAKYSIEPGDLALMIDRAIKGRLEFKPEWKQELLAFLLDAQVQLNWDFLRFSLIQRAEKNLFYFGDLIHKEENPLEGGTYNLSLARHFEKWLFRSGIRAFTGRPPYRQGEKRQGVYSDRQELLQDLVTRHPVPAVWAFELKLTDEGAVFVPTHLWAAEEQSKILQGDLKRYPQIWTPYSRLTHNSVAGGDLPAEVRLKRVPQLMATGQRAQVLDSEKERFKLTPARAARYMVISAKRYHVHLHQWLRYKMASSSVRYEDVLWVSESLEENE